MTRVTTSQEYKNMMVLLNQIGITDRSDRLRLVSRLLDKRVTSFKELSSEDVNIIVEDLRSWKKIQQERLYNGIFAIESLMFSQACYDSDYQLSDSHVLSDRKSRKEFVKKMAEKYDISEDLSLIHI